MTRLLRQSNFSVWILLTVLSAFSGIILEKPMDLERSKGVGGRTIVSLGNEGVVVGDIISAVVLTNDWIVRPGFEGLRFPLANDFEGRLIAPSRDTNHFLTRFQPDGLPDSTFISPALAGEDMALISDIQVQPDGKILIGCSRRFNGSSPFNGVFQLNPDGSLDQGYTVEPQGDVRQLFPMPDNKVLVNFGGGVRRLLSTGRSDLSFTVIQVSVGTIKGIDLYDDGKIVIAGDFDFAGGVPYQGVARFFSNGDLDFNFAPTNQTFGYEGVKVQSDGKTVVANGTQVLRFLADGRNDPTFVRRKNTDTLYGLEVDNIDRIYFTEGGALFRYSGRYRVRVEALNFPQVLEKSSSIESGWSSIMIVPANTSKDYLIPDFPGVGNTFYRARPIQ
jgi:hypothetical protein